MLKKIFIILGVILLFIATISISIVYLNIRNIYNIGDSLSDMLLLTSRTITFLSAFPFIVAIFIPNNINTKAEETNQKPENIQSYFLKKSKIVIAIIIYFFIEKLLIMTSYFLIHDFTKTQFYNLLMFLFGIIWSLVPFALTFSLKENITQKILMLLALIYFYISLYGSFAQFFLLATSNF